MSNDFEWNGSRGFYHKYNGNEENCGNPNCRKRFQDGDIVTKKAYSEIIVCRYKCEAWYEEKMGKTNWELSPHVFSKNQKYKKIFYAPPESQILTLAFLLI